MKIFFLSGVLKTSAWQQFLLDLISTLISVCVCVRVSEEERVRDEVVGLC